MPGSHVLDPVADPGRRVRRTRLAMAAALLVIGGAVAWWVDSPERPAERGPARPPGAWTMVPHTGLGAWVDVYDWTLELTDGVPTVGLADVDAMADAGVQTLYIQTAHTRSTAAGVVEADRLRPLIERAHRRGLLVVAWYLPSLVDVKADLRRLEASAALPIDGLAVDIESVEVADVAERNRRLLQLSADLREQLGPDKVLAAITPSAVQLQVVNPSFWPAFPWAELTEPYDAMLPMTYWSLRQGELRDGERYVGDNLDRIRASTGEEDLPIIAVGGVADGVTIAELEGMVRAIQARGGTGGGGLYDWATSTPDQWRTLQPLRDLRLPVQTSPAPTTTSPS